MTIEVDYQFSMIPFELMRDDRLTNNAKVMYVHMMTFANDKKTAWPSISKMSEESGFAEATVRKLIRELKDAGWVIVTPRFYDEEMKIQTSNKYTMVTRMTDGKAKTAAAEVLSADFGPYVWTEEQIIAMQEAPA